MCTVEVNQTYSFSNSNLDPAKCPSSIRPTHPKLKLKQMRKIESQMNQAINQEIDWKKDNTQVINIEGTSFVYLFDNLIAMIGDTWLELFDGGHQSNTTKSRLNAILQAHGNGEYVYQKNFNWFVSTKDGEVPFNNSIKLN